MLDSGYDGESTARASLRARRASMASGNRGRAWILAIALTILVGAGATCVPAIASASGFPATESLDTFERAAESPLSDGGKWSKLGWSKAIGRVFSATFGWTPSEGEAGAAESEASGAYWNGREFNGPAVSVHMYAESLKDYVGVWCDAAGASSSKSGYRLKVLGTGTSYGFKLLLEKWVSGTRTLLAESHEIAFKGFSSENIVGVTAIGGKVQAWYGTTEAGLVVEAEAADSTFSHGYVGLEGTNKGAYGETKYRASQNETMAEREAKEKAEREAKEKAEREAKEKAEREAKEKAEREAKEKAEREAKEKAEREAKEKAEREAREREKAEREKVEAGDPCLPVHCYAIASQESATTAGLNVSIETSYATVPEDKYDRMQNEAWSQFQRGVTWVEGGATTGYIGGPNQPGKVTPGYVYFTATKTTSCSCSYVENDFENGPGGNNYFPVDEHYVGSNTWYITAGNDLVGYGGEPTTSSIVQAGLEETNDNITNWGHLAGLSWWDPTTGVKHQGWSDGTITQPEPPKQVTCISLQGSEEAYFVANGNPCTLGGVRREAHPGGEDDSSTAATVSSPLSAASALAYGRDFATRYGGAATPAAEKVYATSETGAMHAVEHGATIPKGSAAATALSDRVYVVVMHGRFALPYAPVPPGAKAPSGDNLSVVFNATTGHVLNVALTPSLPDASTLGAALASSG